MSNGTPATKAGLQDVIAADSAIGRIDGEKGELRYRGYLIKDLADSSNFVETTLLLLDGELPPRARLEAFTEDLKRLRPIDPLIVDLLRTLAPRQAPMDCLRTVVSALSAIDRPQESDGMDVHRERGVRVIAQLPTLLAFYARLRDGKPVIEPRDDLGHAANFLWMLTGEEPSDEVARMFDVCLTLHAEHGFNASTFSARVTAATLSDMYSAITSAIGTLKGPLHGGANTGVMQMLLEIGDVAKAEPYIEKMLGERKKVMGFGHRVYKVVDPRALILKEFSRKLAQRPGSGQWFEMSERIEKLMRERKSIDVNVDFYSATTYYQMGIAPDLFTGIFAISRVSGWVAHVLEQLANNRLIRPRANWIGSGPREYVPIDQRG